MFTNVVQVKKNEIVKTLFFFLLIWILKFISLFSQEEHEAAAALHS